MRPQDIVALTLALMVLTVIIGGVAKSLLIGHDTPAYLAEHWAEIMALLIGGLIAYMAGSK